MSYRLYLQPGEPHVERLPVLKLRCPGKTPVDDRIYAQAQLGLTDEVFFARLWAFENDPAPHSRLSVLLEGPKGRVELFATADGHNGLLTPGGETAQGLTAYRISGEDLQGEYWGVTLMAPRSMIAELLGLGGLTPGECLRGNVIKRAPGCSAAFLPEGELTEPFFLDELLIV